MLPICLTWAAVSSPAITRDREKSNIPAGLWQGEDQGLELAVTINHIKWAEDRSLYQAHDPSEGSVESVGRDEISFNEWTTAGAGCELKHFGLWSLDFTAIEACLKHSFLRIWDEQSNKCTYHPAKWIVNESTS